MSWAMEAVLLSLSTIIPILVAVAFYTVSERKLMAGMQRRRGPTEVGVMGLLQAFADGLKLLVKEVIQPSGFKGYMFFIAPMSSFSLSLMVWSVSPMGESGFVDLKYGVLLSLVLLTLMVYGLSFAGWSSNSRYAFLGGVRAVAQMISYELVLTMNVLMIAFVCGSLNFSDVKQYQTVSGSFMWLSWPMFLVFSVVILAETNRTPFDLPEAEAELVAGYNVEYSASPFSLFFLSEYCTSLLLSFMTVMLWSGGSGLIFVKFLVSSTYFVVSRAVLPRLRYDQLMGLGWKILLPLSLGYSCVVGGACSYNMFIS